METLPSRSSVVTWVRKYWFMVGLLAICLMTVADRTGLFAGAGKWLKDHQGPGLVVAAIFLLSGFALSAAQIGDGLKDLSGTLLAFAVIFIIAPLTAVLFSAIPLSEGIVVGLLLVAVMPSTLSSGVVMTDAAGGSAAHALVITVAANILSVVTIPLVLSLLLTLKGLPAAVSIDKGAIMFKIGLLVVAPLAVGMTWKYLSPLRGRRLERRIPVINQCLILFIVWIAMSQTRGILMSSGPTVGVIVALVFAFHGILLLAAWGLVRLAGREHGSRESVLFMGGQKTLPLSIILQMSLFPHYGVALLVCVLHHIVHLLMDGYLVEKLKGNRPPA